MKSTATKPKKVAVGLSGGVDSSVSAYLLQKQGYEVVGVYMQCWDYPDDGCAANEDKMYAVQSAAKLGIKIESLDFIKEYKERVISYFYSEYNAGRTPNPDVMCNKEIKFGLFFKWAMEQGFDYVATGHYARIGHTDTGEFSLLKGTDSSKDQSYFLYTLDQEHLAKTLFPVGGMLKSEVREIASEIDLPTASRPDSTGICFIGEVDIKKFLMEKIKPKKGNVVLKEVPAGGNKDTEESKGPGDGGSNADGEVIGTHEGAWFYTIGQRRGFTVTKYQGKPLYVIGKDVDTNELFVGFEEDTWVSELDVENIHWIGKDLSAEKVFDCDVRIRHLGKIYPVSVNLPHIKLQKPAFGIAPGQSVVFYKDDMVLGGGIIQ